jgi:predicted nucleic acid-binding protein
LQEKVVFDTGVYIGVFNRGLHQEEINGLNKVMYLAHPVLHELWLGARGRKEVRHLERFLSSFIRLKRLITPSPSTQLLIGRICRALRSAGKLDPRQPRLYNDVCIAVLARQIGATLVTTNPSDFEQIVRFVDFRYREVC